MSSSACGAGCSDQVLSPTLCPSGLGQLLVWEWQSESYVLKQQGHFNSMVSLAYSPDGQYIVTGGDDGKVGCAALELGWSAGRERGPGGRSCGVLPLPSGRADWVTEALARPQLWVPPRASTRLVRAPEKAFTHLPGSERSGLRSLSLT